MAKLKTLPKMILIGALVGGALYGAQKFGAIDKVIPQQESMAKILSTGVIRVAVENPAPPFFYQQNGTNTGFNVEFLNLMLKQGEFAQKPISIQYVSVDEYSAVPKKVAAGEADIAIDGLTFPDGTPSSVSYSVPYIEDFGYALIGPKSLNVASSNGINSLTIGILQGDPDVKAFVTKEYPSAKIVELSDASTSGGRTWINDNISSGKIDGIVYDYPFGVSEIAPFGNLQFVFSKLPNSDIRYKIGVKSSDAKLMDAVNTSIRRVKSSPEYVELLKKYFMAKNTIEVKAQTTSEKVYVVRKGDTLAGIAQNILGSPTKYAAIQSRNNIPNPNLIQVDQRLIIPQN